MEGVISNYRQGRHHQHTNQMIVVVNSVKTIEAAGKLVGNTVVWKNSVGKEKIEIKGRVKKEHGNSGALRVTFEKGMPGQSIGTKVNIQG